MFNKKSITQSIEIKNEGMTIRFSDLKKPQLGQLKYSVGSYLIEIQSKDISAKSRILFLNDESPADFFKELKTLSRDNPKTCYQLRDPNLIIKADIQNDNQITLTFNLRDDDSSEAVWTIITHITIPNEHLEDITKQICHFFESIN